MISNNNDDKKEFIDSIMDSSEDPVESDELLTNDEENNNIDNNEELDDGLSLNRNSSYTNHNNNQLNNKNDVEFLKITFKSNSKEIRFMRMPSSSGDGDGDDKYDRLDSIDEASIDRINSKISSNIEKLRGSGFAKVMEGIGCPIEVDMSWDKELKRYIDDMTSTSNSNRTYASWSKQNIYTRHIAYLPGRLPIPVNNPNIYIMFDQSGSMSNNELRKINYLINYFFEKKYNIILMIHDWAQSTADVQLYEFSKNKKSTDNFQLEKIINSRILAGGTSHKGVFDLMEEYIKEIKITHKKYNIQYCLICSDLYSDIEEIWKNYEWPKLIGNNTFALTSSADIKLPFGKTINILSDNM